MSVSRLSEVAQLAGVSLATASRVLNGSVRKPGRDVTRRVRAAAENLSYIPNAQAQSLAKSTSGLIGLIVHDIADPYFSTIARGVQAAARAQQKSVLLATTNGTPDEERTAVAAFATYRVDLIVMAGSRMNRPQDQASNAQLAAELDRYCQNGGRVGVIGYPIIGATASEGYHVVPIPNEELAAELATNLAKFRPKEFVIMAGPDGRLSSEDRIRGFQRGLSEAGMPPAQVLKTSFDRNGGYMAGLKLSRRIKAFHQSPTGAVQLCVLATNDTMAIGATAALASEGIGVPHEVLISGFDGIELIRDFEPKIPTVALPLDVIGQIVAGEHSVGASPGDSGKQLHFVVI